jgi:hypothetical protein
MKNETAEKVTELLNEQGVKATRQSPLSILGNMVMVNRDSMCQSKFSIGGCPEEGTYPAVLKAINDQFPGHRFYWFSKNDEDLFLDAMFP